MVFRPPDSSELLPLRLLRQSVSLVALFALTLGAILGTVELPVPLSLRYAYAFPGELVAELRNIYSAPIVEARVTSTPPSTTALLLNHVGEVAPLPGDNANPKLAPGTCEGTWAGILIAHNL